MIWYLLSVIAFLSFLAGWHIVRVNEERMATLRAAIMVVVAMSIVMAVATIWPFFLIWLAGGAIRETLLSKSRR